MASTRLVLVACLFNAVGASSVQGGAGPLRPEDGRRVEIDSAGAIIRRSADRPENIPAAALEDASQRAQSDSFTVVSADAKFESSGLMKTLHMLEHGQGLDEENKSPPLGTILLLVNSSDEEEMQNLEKHLVPSLLSSLKFRTPVTVMFSGPFQPADDATFKLHLNAKIKPLTLVDVTQRVEQFEHVPEKEKRGQGERWKMDEFWAMHVHLLPELQNYHYGWRLSPKSILKADVTSDLYQVMRQQKAVFGYRLLENVHTQACDGLQEAATTFYEANTGWAPEAVTARAFLETYEQAHCPQWTSDFQLVDLDYLRSNEVYGEYVAYLAEKDGFSKHGWGSHSAQTIFLATQLAPEKLLCMTPWVPKYQGESKTSCDAGLGLINFGQNAFKDSESQAEVLQVEEVHHEVHHHHHHEVPLNVSNNNVSTVDTHSTVATKWHGIFIALSVFVAVSLRLVFKKGWIRRSRGRDAIPDVLGSSDS